MNDHVHSLFRDILRPLEPVMSEKQTVLAEALQIGDELLDSAIGGYRGFVQGVHVYPDYTVRVDFREPGQSVRMCAFEVCQVVRKAP